MEWKLLFHFSDEYDLYQPVFTRVPLNASAEKEELPACGKLLFSHFCIPLTAENISAPLIYRRKLTGPMRLTR